MPVRSTISDIIARLHGGSRDGELAAQALTNIDARLRALEPCQGGNSGGRSHVWEDKACRRCDLRRPVTVPNASGYGPGEVTAPAVAPMGGAVAAAVAAESDACARIAGDIDAAERAISKAHGCRPVDAYVVHIAGIVIADIVERIEARKVSR